MVFFCNLKKKQKCDPLDSIFFSGLRNFIGIFKKNISCQMPISQHWHRQLATLRVARYWVTHLIAQITLSLFSWKRLLWIKLLVNRWHPRMNQQPTFHHLVLLGEGGLEFSCFGCNGSGFQPWYMNTYNNFNSLNGHVKENYYKVRYRNKFDNVWCTSLFCFMRKLFFPFCVRHPVLNQI